MNPNDDLGRPDKGERVWFQGSSDIAAQPDQMAVPDLIEPLIGWRSWDIAQSYGKKSLVSPHQKMIWHPEPGHVTAVCPHADPSQRSNCQCGINAFFNEQDLVTRCYIHMDAIGQVEMWGEVQSYERGYRAQYAKPIKLWARWAKNEDDVKEVARSWGATYEGVIDLPQEYPEPQSQLKQISYLKSMLVLFPLFLLPVAVFALSLIFTISASRLLIFTIAACSASWCVYESVAKTVQKRALQINNNSLESLSIISITLMVALCIIAAVIAYDKKLSLSSPIVDASVLIQAVEQEVKTPLIFTQEGQDLPHSLIKDSEILSKKDLRAPPPIEIAEAAMGQDAIDKWQDGKVACENHGNIRWCLTGNEDLAGNAVLWAMPLDAGKPKKFKMPSHIPG